uniref:Group XV phospholipase A2 n=2 Tax=Lygus hesperus TaxID=30085 RepID=A0A0A9W7S1_LYGHE
MNCIGVLLILCVCMCCDAATRAPPVIIVPGLGGSRLEAKLNRTSSEHFLCEKTSKDYFPIWFSYEFLVPVVKQCWMDNIKLTYDNVTRTTSSHPGVDIRVPGFGNPRYVEWLDAEERLVGVFNTLAASLVDLGYERNVSLRAVPYDFRKGPSESGMFFESLKSLVESTYKINGKSQGDVAGPQYGGSDDCDIPEETTTVLERQVHPRFHFSQRRLRRVRQSPQNLRRGRRFERILHPRIFRQNLANIVVQPSSPDAVLGRVEGRSFGGDAVQKLLYG